MEKVVFRNSRNLSLVGNLFLSGLDSIIVMCHGFCSDKYSKGRFERLAESFNREGYSALAFDFSGCGESDDGRLSAEKQVDDLKSAITFVKSRGFKKIALYGHSLGSLICLKGFQSDIVTMVLSGACTGPMKYNWEEYFTKDQIVELKDRGYITENRFPGVRKQNIIDKRMLEDFESVDQREILTQVTCPILIIHGNNDEEEKLLCEWSKKALDLLPKKSRLEIIDGADHSFMSHMDKLIPLATEWFAQHLD